MGRGEVEERGKVEEVAGGVSAIKDKGEGESKTKGEWGINKNTKQGREGRKRREGGKEVRINDEGKRGR